MKQICKGLKYLAAFLLQYYQKKNNDRLFPKLGEFFLSLYFFLHHRLQLESKVTVKKSICENSDIFSTTE